MSDFDLFELLEDVIEVLDVHADYERHPDGTPKANQSLRVLRKCLIAKNKIEFLGSAQ